MGRLRPETAKLETIREGEWALVGGSNRHLRADRLPHPGPWTPRGGYSFGYSWGGENEEFPITL
jgi:hypothetical protein